jgi:hypothetical protein
LNERATHEVLIHQSFNPIYSNATEDLDQFPVSSENIDYVAICPVATTALKELSTSRSNDFKRSNSLYDILSIHQQKDSAKQNSEAEYYASFDWTTAMGPRAFTSSASYLTHLMNKGQNNIQRKESVNSFAKKMSKK